MYKQRHVYFVTSNDSVLIRPLGLKKYRQVKFESNEKRHKTLFTHRRVFVIYLQKLSFTCILDFTDKRSRIAFQVQHSHLLLLTISAI